MAKQDKNQQQQSGINAKEAMKAIVEASKKLHASFLELTDVAEERKGLIADELQKLFVQQIRIANGIGQDKDLKAATELGKKFAELAAGSMPAKNYKLFDDLHLEIMIGLSKVFQDHSQSAGGKQEKAKQTGKQQAKAESEESKKERQAKQQADKAKQQAKKEQAAKVWNTILNFVPSDHVRIDLKDVAAGDYVYRTDGCQTNMIMDAGKQYIVILSHYDSKANPATYNVPIANFTLAKDGSCYQFVSDYHDVTTTDQFIFYRKKTA